MTGFARYWNRPMGRWRFDFTFQLLGLVMFSAAGPPLAYIGMGSFTLILYAWTRDTVRGYRRGERAGSRHRNINRDDIWKGPND